MHGLQHPFVHRVHDVIFGSFQPSKLEPATGKVILLRDYVSLGSVRDRLHFRPGLVPLMGFEEKYPAGKPGQALPQLVPGGNTTTEPLHLLLVAKQVLSGMVFLESIGLRVDFVHCGNVLLLSDGKRTASGQLRPCVAISDFENALVNLVQPRYDPEVYAATEASVVAEEEGGGADEEEEATPTTRREFRAEAVDKACEAAALHAFGLMLYELASGARAPDDAKGRFVMRA